MPMEHEATRPPSPAPEWVGRGLLLLCALLLAVGMTTDNGPRGAFVAAACFAAGLGISRIVRAVARRRSG